MTSEKEKTARTASSHLELLFTDLWLASIGLFGRTESELQKITERLRPVMSENEKFVTELVTRFRQQGADFERWIDESVRRAVALIAESLRNEVISLRKRIDTITVRLDRQRMEHATDNSQEIGSEDFPPLSQKGTNGPPQQEKPKEQTDVK